MAGNRAFSVHHCALQLNGCEAHVQSHALDSVMLCWCSSSRGRNGQHSGFPDGIADTETAKSEHVPNL